MTSPTEGMKPETHHYNPFACDTSETPRGPTFISAGRPSLPVQEPQAKNLLVYSRGVGVRIKEESIGGVNVRSIVVVVLLAGLLAISAQTQEPASKPIFKLHEVMIPVRDGVKLQTAVLTPVDQRGPLPILFRRTPYGVPEKAPEQMPASWKELAQDGYIFVIQNLRGRFKSEGVLELTSQVDMTNP